jgi:small subunit ribosomal protein S17
VQQENKTGRKVREGIVVSNKMSKTVVVLVDRTIRHPLYQKVMRKTKKFKAHDEGNICGIGDKVSIMESRPISKDKKWVVLKVLSKGVAKLEDEDKGMPMPIRKAKEANDTN